MSSPGSGKTTLLEKSIKALEGRRPVAVIEGDQQTLNDAEMIRLAVKKVKTYALSVNPDLQIIELSAKTGQGMENWID